MYVPFEVRINAEGYFITVQYVLEITKQTHCKVLAITTDSWEQCEPLTKRGTAVDHLRTR